MPHCAVKQCPIRSSAKTKYQTELETKTKITFHRFPKEATRRLQWTTSSGLQSTTLPKNASICSLHFVEDSFDRTSVSCVRLKNDAIPCLNVPDVNTLNEDNFLPQGSQASCSLIGKPSSSAVTEEEILGEAMVEELDVTVTLSSRTGSQKRCRECKETCDVDTQKRQCKTSILGEKNVQYPRTTADISTQTTSDMDSSSTPIQTCDKPTAMSPHRIQNSPRKALLRKAMQYQQETSRKAIQALKKRNQRQGKRIAALRSVLNELRAKNLLAEEHYDILETIGRSNVHILKRLVAKTASRVCKGKKVKGASKEYSPELRTFALTLQYYSPRAYNYVREHFDSCLPHPKTIGSWYRSINADPGFLEEAFACIAERVKAVDYKLIGTLVFDEMSIRQHIEYDGTKYCGYVDLGPTIASDTTTIAKEALVFLFVCMNGAWKIPIGYFLINGVTADQKCNLILQSISLLHEAGVKVSILTFDGTSTNLCTVKKLECNLKPDSLQTHFMHPVTKDKVFIFPDPSHMAKLARNIFGDVKVLIDGNQQKVEWKVLEQLQELQNNEGLHLANKLRSAHIHYQKQKMKVRLATQVFSTSVADSLQLCRSNLQLPQFEHSFPTETFLRIMNDLFDILNSKNIHQVNFKKPLNSMNYSQILKRMDECKDYILQLALPDGQRVLDTTKRTGFLGFLICIESLKGLYEELCCKTTLLKYIPTYKASQDHVELFFGCIRSHGGHNNNPTVRQFKAAIKKLLIHSEVRDAGSGNCIPLENITILHVSSTRNSEKIINMSSRLARIDHEDIMESLPDLDPILNTAHDHSYLPDIRTLTNFSSRAIAYIAGFVVRHLKKTLRCDDCIEALCGDENHLESSLISIKTRGGLQYPSEDVIKISKVAEKTVRFALKESGGRFMDNKYSEGYLVNCVLSQFTESNVLFTNLREHSHDQSALESHDIHLTRAILCKYINIRLFYIGKEAIDYSNSERHRLNKLTLFKGQ